MGFSGGFKQGKPGKALLELKQECNSKFKAGQLGGSKTVEPLNPKVLYYL